jgi:hypothetical protein
MKHLVPGFLVVLGLCASASAQQCLEYGPTVTLTGTLRAKVFPGPPNYESIKRGDRAETAIILSLATPLCTAAGNPADIVDVAETDVRDVQLVITKPSDWKLVKRLVGKPVVLTGTLFHSHTGHHRTKVLLTVAELKPKP